MATNLKTIPAPAMFDKAASRFKGFGQGDNAKVLRKAISDANRAEEANGFEANLAVTEHLAITYADLADWNPNSDNAAEREVKLLHYRTAPESSPNGLKMIREALFWAVCALPEDKAKAARNGGNGSDDEPEYGKVVPVRLLSTTGAKPRHFDGTAADALSALQKARDTQVAAKDKDGAEIYDMAIAAHADALNGDFNKLRRFGALKNSRQTRATRWRGVLYLNVCKPALQAYASNDPIVAVGKVWKDVVAAAQTTHKAYWEKVGENNPPSVETLTSEIDGAVNVILGKKAEVQSAAKEEVDEVEELKKAVSRVLSACKAIDDMVDKSTLWTRTESYLSGLGIETSPKRKGKAGKAAPTEDAGDDAPAPKAPKAAPMPPAGNAVAPRKRAPVATPATPVTADAAGDAIARMKQAATGK